MPISLPKNVLSCLNTLESNGFEAFCVGGAVRDLLMGKEPTDYDITTNALPTDIIALFKKTVPTGLKHGTVTVVTSLGNIEVTTYRCDGDYFDHRAPDSVSFTRDVLSDLSRRDFTMNAILCKSNGDIIDPLSGYYDIKNETIRAIGDPEKRFNEDALRIMRAFRFSCQLGFSIEERTMKGALSLCKTLEKISVERIFSELYQSFSAQNPENIFPLIDSGALSFVGIQKNISKEIFINSPDDFSFRFALFSKANNLDQSVVLKTLHSDNNTIASVKTYIMLLSLKIPKNKTDIKKMLMISDVTKTETVLKYYEKLSILSFNGIDELTALLRAKEPYSLNMLAINGDDLKKIGLKNEMIGKTLQLLLEKVINDPLLNEKETLIKISKECV